VNVENLLLVKDLKHIKQLLKQVRKSIRKMIKLTDILKEITQSEKSPAYMYSPVGFGCHVCKFYYVENEKHMCGNSYYQEHMGTAELVDNEGNQIKDPSKWCSNWFLPKGE
jgi:hypothetical protein